MIPTSFSARAILAAFFVSSLAAATSTAGTLTGTVRSAATSQPLGSIVVDAYDTAGTLRGSGTTDQSGTYILALPAGTYRVLAWDRLGTYATMFDDNAESFETSRVTTVGTDDTVRRDFSLVVAGLLVGSVVRSNGTAAAGVVVEIYNLSGTRRAFARTDAQGMYSIVLPGGEYKVIAYDPNGEYSFAFFPGVRTFAEASRVSVTSARTTAAIDIRLEVAAHLSGIVVDLSTGLPVDGIAVYAYTPAGLQVTATSTSANGMFALSLPAGDYRVVAADPARRYATGFYGLGRAFETSLVLTLKAGATQGNVQLGLMRGATIGGRVVNESGMPVPNVNVAAYNLDGTLHAQTATGADGTYELLVAPGAYRLLVFDTSLVYVTAFLDGARDFSSSAALGVASGQAVRGFDFMLRRGGRIAGTVREDGVPRVGITVAAYDPAGLLSGTGTTGADGTFAFVVPPGEYRVVAFDSALVYAPAYDGGASTFEATVPRAIGAGTSGTVDFALRRGITVRGLVWDAAEHPVDVNVFALDAAGNRVAGATSSETGFAMAIPPGIYRFVAIDPRHRFAVTYWDGAATFAAARVVNVAEGLPIPTLVFRLERVMRRRGVRS